MTLLGWWVVTCSGVSLATISIFGMVSFWDSSFHATQWMIYCLFVGVALLTGKVSQSVPVSLTLLTWMI